LTLGGTAPQDAISCGELITDNRNLLFEAEFKMLRAMPFV
jgi:hypothetical protein